MGGPEVSGAGCGLEVGARTGTLLEGFRFESVAVGAASAAGGGAAAALGSVGVTI